MLIVDLAGNHYEMGYQHGSKLIHYRPGLLRLIAEYHQMFALYPHDVLNRITDEVTNLLLIYSPQTIDMLKGIADSFTVPLKDIFLIRIASYIEDGFSPNPKSQDQDGECTTWAISTPKSRQNRIILAKNRDFLILIKGLQVIFRCKTKGKFEYFSINSIGSCNVSSSGINAAGFAIADTRVPSLDVGLGLPRFSLMMHILENFSSVREVIDFLKSVPRMGGGNLIFADAKGDIGKAEVGFESLEITQKDIGYVVSTNHFEGPSIREKYRRKGEEEEKHSRYRYEKVTQTLSNVSEGMDLDDAIKLMSHHGEKFAICRHSSNTGFKKTATISSTIFLPERKGFYHCEGFPCEEIFQWISF